MAVRIRLARHGTKKVPFYRVVVTDHRNPRDGRFIENIGTFDPTGTFKIDFSRLSYWREQGADTSPTVARLLKKHPPQAT